MFFGESSVFLTGHKTSKGQKVGYREKKFTPSGIGKSAFCELFRKLVSRKSVKMGGVPNASKCVEPAPGSSSDQYPLWKVTIFSL